MENQIMAKKWGTSDASIIPYGDNEFSHKLTQSTDSDEGAVTTIWSGEMMRPVTLATAGTEVIYDVGVYDRLSRIEEDIREVKTMLQKIYDMVNPHHEILELRDISHHQAKKEIASYFENHHGETFNEADLQEALKISIWMVIDICEELEKEGKVGGI